MLGPPWQPWHIARHGLGEGSHLYDVVEKFPTFHQLHDLWLPCLGLHEVPLEPKASESDGYWWFITKHEDNEGELFKIYVHIGV